MGEEVPADLEFHTPGAVEDPGSGQVFEGSLNQRENGGEGNDVDDATPDAELQLVHGKLYQEGDGRRKGGGYNKDCNALKKNSPISFDIGDDELNLFEHGILKTCGQYVPRVKNE